MALENEHEVLKALDIPSFSSITHEKTLELAKLVRAGGVDENVVAFVMEQVPDLNQQMGMLTESADKTEQRVFEANDQSMEDITGLWQTTLNAYLKQLENPNLSEEERRDIRDRIDAGNKRVFDKETENKQFLFSVDANKKRFVIDVAKGLGGAAVAVLAYANKDKLALPKRKKK